MANNVTLENEISKLHARLAELSANVENDMPDLTDIEAELGVIARRAETLRATAEEMENLLSALA